MTDDRTLRLSRDVEVRSFFRPLFFLRPRCPEDVILIPVPIMAQSPPDRQQSTSGAVDLAFFFKRKIVIVREALLDGYMLHVRG